MPGVFFFDVVSLSDRLRQLIDAFEDRFPDARFELTVPDDPCEVAAVGVVSAIEEAVENAVVHNDSADPVVELAVTRRSAEWVDIEIMDNGPGIPEQEVAVLQTGETSLQHADRLGFWLIFWAVRKAGGEFSVSEATDGSVVELSVPAYQE